ncbi:membrane protein [Pullulanibacillus camelliae]|uniref:Membrane protein n=1 Tax=Pullulanibacillus camelliae TaxID=1707096 RepID=A0A8J2YHE4_9BACL|nr:DUF2905 domain-containing protein [Pullulanibacillus camelliae]GGE42804.1 membrane protein [Pullulanibacillus camelliae]
MQDMAKLLMLIGMLLFLFGALWYVIGRLPGDIVIKKGHTTFYFPIMTSIVISLVLSLIVYIVNRFR